MQCQSSTENGPFETTKKGTLQTPRLRERPHLAWKWIPVFAWTCAGRRWCPLFSEVQLRLSVTQSKPVVLGEALPCRQAPQVQALLKLCLSRFPWWHARARGKKNCFLPARRAVRAEVVRRALGPGVDRKISQLLGSESCELHSLLAK